MLKFHRYADVFPMMTGNEFDQLKSDIQKNGLLEPIILYENKIIDGRNRYRACLDVKIEPKFKNWEGKGSLIDFIISMNLHRRHLNESQRAACALEILRFLEQEAKARMRAGGGDKRIKNVKKPGVEKVPHPVNTNGAKSRDQAAKLFGTNGKYVSDVKKIAQESPEYIDKIKSGELTIPKAKKQIKREKIFAEAEKIKKEPLPFPNGRFRVIVIDPPWEYDSRQNDVSHRAANPYPSMTIEQIEKLPMAELALDDCILWLWTTNAHMEHAFKIARGWGFEQKTILTWVKNKFGLGDWLRGQTEHCLLCVKGKPVVTLTNQSTVLHGDAREHSRKPDEFYAMVESLCPGSKLEMFARQQRTNWTSYGNETERFRGKA